MQKALVVSERHELASPWPTDEPYAYEQAAPRTAPSFAAAMRRWRLVLPVAALGGLAAYLVCQMFTPLYAGKASVMIDPREPKRAAVSADPNSAIPPSEETVRKNEIAVIRSRTLAEQVITDLGLQADPELNPTLRSPSPLRRAVDRAVGDANRVVAGWLTKLGVADPAVQIALQPPVLDQTVDGFLNHLSVTSTEASRVIEIRFLSTDPVRAALVANTVADEYMKQRVEHEVAPAQAATQSLEGEIAALNQKVTQADEAGTRMRFEDGSVPAGDLKALGVRLDELNKQLAMASAERAKAAGRVADLHAAIAAGRVETIPDVLNSRLIQNLREQSAKLAAKIANMSTFYGQSYPGMSQARAEFADLHKQINQEVSKIASSYSSDLSVAQDKEATLRRMITQVTSDIAKASMSDAEVHSVERAADARRSLMSQLVTRLNDTRAEMNRKGPEARVISRATLARWPSFPPTIPIVIGGMMMAATAAMLIAMLLEYRDRSIRSTSQLRYLTSARVLGTIPAIGHGRPLRRSPPPARVLADRASMFADHLRAVWFRIDRAKCENAKTFLITSSVPGEGKSTIVASLARLLASGKRSVVIVDADLRRRSLHRTLGVKQTPGLTELIRGDCTLEQALQVDSASGASVISAGSPVASSADILQSQAMKDLLDTLANRFEAVLIDTPPVLAVHDAGILAPWVDMTIMVVRWGATREASFFAALQQLHDLDVPVNGVILSRVDQKKYSPDLNPGGAARLMRAYYHS